MSHPRIAAIVLAAGRSTRWGEDNKLTAPIDGTPMLLRTLHAVLASTARPVILVTGHERDFIRSLVSDLPLSIVHASRFADGLAESLKAGIAAIPDDCDGALACLGDMPFVRSDTLDRLIQAYEPETAALIPTYNGRRGNPVLLKRDLFAAIQTLSGDQGARAILTAMPERVREVVVDDPGIMQDFDVKDAPEPFIP